MYYVVIKHTHTQKKIATIVKPVSTKAFSDDIIMGINEMENREKQYTYCRV